MQEKIQHWMKKTKQNKINQPFKNEQNDKGKESSFAWPPSAHY